MVQESNLKNVLKTEGLFKTGSPVMFSLKGEEAVRDFVLFPVLSCTGVIMCVHLVLVLCTTV